jgi:hypothetical protein
MTSHMVINLLAEHGYDEAMLGLSMSYNSRQLDMPEVADSLCANNKTNSGELKFLESIAVWLDITAPRYWWNQFDTYRIGVTKQSESTMHTLMRDKLTQDDFQIDIPQETLDRLNHLRCEKLFEQLVNELPQGYLQRRIVCTNYQALRHIIEQRHNHKLIEWRLFCKSILELLRHYELLHFEYYKDLEDNTRFA